MSEAIKPPPIPPSETEQLDGISIRMRLEQTKFDCGGIVTYYDLDLSWSYPCSAHIFPLHKCTDQFSKAYHSLLKPIDP